MCKKAEEMSYKEWEEYLNTHSLKEVEEKAAEIKCTMCGKPFDSIDVFLGDNRYDLWVGYGSVHDDERIKFNFCCECFDKVLDTIIPMCKIDPIVDYDVG